MARGKGLAAACAKTLILLGIWFLISQETWAAEIPAWLPKYDLDIQLGIDQHEAHVRERVTWHNRHEQAATELVFNAHSHYKLPPEEIGKVAKILELLRMSPGEGIDFDGHACDVQKVRIAKPETRNPKEDSETQDPKETGEKDSDFEIRISDFGFEEVPFHFRPDNETALVIPLPRPVKHGESVTVEIEFIMHLPQKQGRWGQWQDVTFLSNWLPVLAYYDDKGWQPTPFIPWHQPFFNEAGSYHAVVTLPADQKIACTGTIQSKHDIGKDLQQVEISVPAARDFAFLCSPRFQEFTGQAGPVKVRCLALPEHEHYAQFMVQCVCEAIPVYNQWFGPYPYPEFTVVESYFGWNGNECAGLVMIDERIFGMPHAAAGFVDQLVSHETCHQWWYNVVGTNGYAETWMDEGLATYFSHRLMDQKHGKNSNLLTFPKALEWLPNIQRETYRTYTMLGTIGRGEAGPTVQEMPRYKHLANLLSMCYDRGGRIVGIIEEHLDESAFLDFMRIIYSRYYFRILRVADFQRELETYTGRSWEQFFHDWLYGSGMSDWCLDDVKIEPAQGRLCRLRRKLLGSLPAGVPCKATVLLKQKAENTEQTVLGIRLNDGDGYQIRIPIQPGIAHLELENPKATVDFLSENCVRVVVELDCQPTQIAVDPDRVLVDADPSNNTWKPEIRWRFVPLYTQLEETDLTTAYDRWNVIVGPWIYGPSYRDPWFTRSTMAGLRAGVYRTQEFSGGAYAAYRTDDRDLVVGVDGLWSHWPWHATEVGFNLERSVGSIGMNQPPSDRGVLFGRYVFQYSSSLYLPPMQYLEAFTSIQNNNLPPPSVTIPGAVRIEESTTMGLHYHKDYLTPYWDPEAGYRFDVTYATGIPIFGAQEAFNAVQGQLSFVKTLPDWMGWLAETRLAGRAFAGVGLPDKGEYFTLGGGDLFRGFDLKQRQGSLVWVGSLEWRVPLARGLKWDIIDHSAGVRNVYVAPFYDVGNAYVEGHPVGDVAQALGVGLRLDVAWFGFVERTILRVDVAKTINANSPVQVWVGVQQPF
ncbi:MAG TPA: M1 family aminopeptidase [Gemmataceae bacterium]|jgi:hypothetical protein|nr:M1 family aminopeptidase [Gemmataceae bacterium]